MATAGAVKKHRGALQAQGVDITTNNGTVSKGWAEVHPYEAAAAHEDLDHVHSMLTTGQQLARVNAFKLAREFIDLAKAAGGLTVTGRRSRSFPRLQPEETDIRVDIQIHSGTAFV